MTARLVRWPAIAICAFTVACSSSARTKKPETVVGTPVTNTHFATLSRAQSEAYQLVRNIRDHEGERRADQCIACRTAYRQAKGNVDAFLNQMTVDIKSESASMDSVFYNVLGDSVASSAERLVVAHDRFLGAQHMSDELSDFFLKLGMKALEIGSDIVGTYFRTDDSAAVERIEALRWKDFDNVQ